MKRVLCLRFPNWAVQRQQQLQSAISSTGSPLRLAIHTPVPQAGAAAGRSADEQQDTALVRDVFPSSKGGATIIGSSQAAWQQGVRPGLPLGEARSMAAPGPQLGRSPGQNVVETHFVEWDPGGDREALTELAEHARMFAPVIGLENSPLPDCLLLDITGCGMLFQGESVLAERLLLQFRRLGWQCRATISDSAATAWAFAHPGGHQLLQPTGPEEMDARFDQSWRADSIIIPPEQSSVYLGSFPVAAARIPLADIRILSELGLLTLQQLLNLPVDDLPSRLSDITLQRIRQLTGVEEELIVSIPEARPIQASWVSEVAATNRSEIRQVADHLVQELEPQLRRRSVGAIGLQMTMKHEDGNTEMLAAEVVSPLQDAARLLEVLHLRIESLHLRQPVFSVSMTTTVAPLPIPRQQDLFSTNEHLEPQEELTTVVNRLNNRLGANAVLTAYISDSAVPENTVHYVAVMPHTSTARRTATTVIERLVQPDDSREPTPFVSRPVFLLPSPISIPPVERAGFSFSWEGRVYEKRALLGPERVQTQWWHEETVHRDYYRLTTRQHAEFWIFQNRNSGDWFLHGVFE